MEDIILKALQRNPEDRYQSIDDFKEDIVQRVLNKSQKESSSTIKVIEKSTDNDWMQNVIKLYHDNKYE